MRRILTALVAVVLTVGGGLAAAMPAQAATDCASPIVDQANLFKGDTAGIMAARQRLVSRGADVYVRTYTTVRPDVDHVFERIVADCPTWQHPKGGTKANIIAIMVSVDPRGLAIKSGDDYGLKLDDTDVGSGYIQGSVIAPRFKEGEFSQGVADGFTAVYDLLFPAPPPVSRPTGGGQVERPVIPERSEPAEPSTPTDWGSVFAGIGIVVGIVVGGILLFVLVMFLIQRRRENAKLASARRKAKASSEAAGTALSDLDARLAAAAPLVKAMVDAGSPETLGENPIQDQLAQAQRDLTEARSTFAGHSTSSSDLDQVNVLGELEDLKVVFDGVSARANSALTTVIELELLGTSFVERAARVPEEISRVRAALQAAVTTTNAAAAHGISLMEATAKLDEAQAAIDEAVAVNEDPAAASQAIAKLDSALAHMAAAQAIVDQTLASHKQATSEVAKAQAALGSAGSAITTGTKAFELLSTKYADEAWSDIRGNGTKASALLKYATAKLAEAATELKAQNWAAVTDLTTEATRACAEITSLMQTALTRLETTQADENRMPSEIEDAAADIAKAAEAEARWDDDVRDAYKEDIAKAQRQLAEARRLLGERPLDPSAVVDAAQAANRAADSIYAGVMGEHEAAEHQRRQAASDLQTATSAVANANEYLQDHPAHTREGDRENLQAAQQALASAERAEHPDAIIRYAQNATELASAAHKAVKKRVKAAHDAAERAARAAAEEAERRTYTTSGSTGYGLPQFPSVQVPTPSWGGSSGGRTHGSSSGWTAPTTPAIHRGGGGGGKTHGTSSAW